MRGYHIAAILMSAVGSVAASAADISGVHVGGSYGNYTAFASRVEPVIVYDYEPGIVMRAYWDMPWANRHYFPRTGHRPKVGRLERISGHRVSRAEDYYRFWSVSSVFAPELPPFVAPLFAAPPPAPLPLVPSGRARRPDPNGP